MNPEIEEIFKKLTPAQVEQLRTCTGHGFSRPTLESVLRQTDAKKKSWLEKANTLLSGGPAVEPPS